VRATTSAVAGATSSPRLRVSEGSRASVDRNTPEVQGPFRSPVRWTGVRPINGAQTAPSSRHDHDAAFKHVLEASPPRDRHTLAIAAACRLLMRGIESPSGAPDLTPEPPLAMPDDGDTLGEPSRMSPSAWRQHSRPVGHWRLLSHAGKRVEARPGAPARTRRQRLPPGPAWAVDDGRRSRRHWLHCDDDRPQPGTSPERRGGTDPRNRRVASSVRARAAESRRIPDRARSRPPRSLTCAFASSTTRSQQRPFVR
jgi:hypothetical protein